MTLSFFPGHLTKKSLTQSKKWLQRKLKATSEPSSFILISNALFCLASLESEGHTSAWCKFCFEVRKEGSGLSACARCKSVSYCCVEHQKAHWKAHKPQCTAAVAGKSNGGSATSSEGGGGGGAGAGTVGKKKMKGKQKKKKK